MAKTALDLTPEELQTYYPGQRHQHHDLAEQRERAWQVARAVAELLQTKFGATRVVVFGSLAHEAWFTPWSDIDLMAWGIPANDFYRAVASVTGFSPEFKIDLLDPVTCRPQIRQQVEREGIEL